MNHMNYVTCLTNVQQQINNFPGIKIGLTVLFLPSKGTFPSEGKRNKIRPSILAIYFCWSTIKPNVNDLIYSLTETFHEGMALHMLRAYLPVV